MVSTVQTVMARKGSSVKTVGTEQKDGVESGKLGNGDDGVRAAVEDSVQPQTQPPAIPHVEINQIPLAMLIRNLTVFTIKEISQYMKTNVHVDPTEPSAAKKIRFLQLVIFLRNQFLKLYVLIKWCRTIKKNNFHTLIDLLNWFRTTNMSVNSCIWALKSSLDSMVNAKLPNADLVTALEVLSLGRPNLPTHGFSLNSGTEKLTQNGIIQFPPSIVLQTLKDLNLKASIKIALMDLPEQFHNYDIRDGRICITVVDEFEIQLATTSTEAPLFFVDLKIVLNDQEITLNRPKIEKVINELLRKSGRPLFGLYRFLHKYVLTLQLHMINLQLSNLESNGKFAGGKLIHRYDPKRSIITVRYWLHMKLGSKGHITIGVDQETDKLVLRWDNQQVARSNIMPVRYTSTLLNLEPILDEIMFNHSHLIRAELLSKGIFQEDEENQEVLLLQMPVTCVSVAPVQLKIDILSGVFFFKNPSPLLQRYAQRINKAETAEELTQVLQRLKLDKITQVLRNMFEKTGWICSQAVKLSSPVKRLAFTDSASSPDQEYSLLQDDLFVCLPNWPPHWYLVLTVLSSNTSCIVEKRISKIESVKGSWQLQYLDESIIGSAKLETMTYQKITNLKKAILNKIINHMVIDLLNKLDIKNKICSITQMSSSLPAYVQGDKKESSSTDLSNSDDCSSVIILELESFLKGSKALSKILESSMFLKIDYANSEVKLFGRFKKDTKMMKCKCDELLIYFIPSDPLAFYLGEKFTHLNLVMTRLAKFRQTLMELVTLTNLVERLHKSFDTEYFKIVAMKPKEISFKYLPYSNNVQDCTIHITTGEDKLQNLKVELAPSNPQYLLQPFIERENMDYMTVFNYLQFISPLFKALRTLQASNAFMAVVESDSSNSRNKLAQPIVDLELHNLFQYQLLYYYPQTEERVSVLIDLKQVSHNSGQRMQFYIHLVNETTTHKGKSMVTNLLRKIREQVFTFGDFSNIGSNPLRYKDAIKLISGIACGPSDVESVLTDIHNLLQDGDATHATPATADPTVSSATPSTTTVNSNVVSSSATANPMAAGVSPLSVL